MSLIFLPFLMSCDHLLNRCMAKWVTFVLLNRKQKNVPVSVFQLTISKSQSKCNNDSDNYLTYHVILNTKSCGLNNLLLY